MSSPRNGTTLFCHINFSLVTNILNSAKKACGYLSDEHVKILTIYHENYFNLTYQEQAAYILHLYNALTLSKDTDYSIVYDKLLHNIFHTGVAAILKKAQLQGWEVSKEELLLIQYYQAKLVNFGVEDLARHYYNVCQSCINSYNSNYHEIYEGLHDNLHDMYSDYLRGFTQAMFPAAAEMLEQRDNSATAKSSPAA
jgi:hypothetical protein